MLPIQQDADSLTLGEIQELRLVMDIKEAAFREESKTKKGKVSGKYFIKSHNYSVACLLCLVTCPRH